MPKSRIKRFLIKFGSYLRIFIVAWMVGIANSMKQESRFMDDTNYRIEQTDEKTNDDPFEEL
ncbi:MAG: hypothetical protein Roseis2KO_35380 [Roseivirga sp.]